MSSVGEKHFLVVTLPAFGHLIPCIALADAIARHGCKASLAVSQFVLDLARRKGTLTPDVEGRVRFIGIEDGIPPGIPETEAFRMAFEKFSSGNTNLQPFLQSLSAGGVPDSESSMTAVIADTFLAKQVTMWVIKEIPVYLFNSFTIASLNKFLRITPETPVDEAVNDRLSFLLVAPPGEPHQPVSGRVKGRALGVVSSLRDVKGVLVNSFLKAEQEALTEMKNHPKASHLEVFCVGPLLSDSVEETPSLDGENAMSWLNKFPAASVIYATFGSTITLDNDRILQLGKALLLLKRPFILSLKQEHQIFLPAELRDKDNKDVPENLVVDWAPQKAVLAHPAVQVFVTHCGWNSTTEAIFFGKPIVAWPTFGDQLQNALWVESIGVGKCVLDLESRTMVQPKTRIEAQHIVNTVNEVLAGGLLDRAKEWSGKMRRAVGVGGSSETALASFLGNSATYKFAV